MMMDQSSGTMGASSTATPSSNVKVAAGYVLTERLGSGSFATVYKGIILAEYQQTLHRGSLGSQQQSTPQIHHQQQQQHPQADAIVAIKAISRSSKKLTKKVLENLDMEIAILRTYRHPNIVCLHQVQKTDRHFYLVLEYCGGGDLQRLIRTRQSGRLSERLCRRLVRDLAAGLGFLWGKELVHRDIKPQNLLLTGPLPVEELMDNPARDDAERSLRGLSGERFMLKIADFGFARHLSGVDLAETMCGSPLYMAPEILVSFVTSCYLYDCDAVIFRFAFVDFFMSTSSFCIYSLAKSMTLKQTCGLLERFYLR
jgi:serine/threonine-protein kinase ULK/ATG1